MGPPIPYPSPATYATGLRSVDAFQTMPGHLHHPTSSSVPPPRYYHENGGNSPSHYDSIVDIQMSRVRNHISEPSNDFETFIRCVQFSFLVIAHGSHSAAPLYTNI